MCNVDLQYGSDSDCERGDGGEFSDNFPISFTIVLDNDHNIEDIDYKIDTSDWYD